MALEGEVHLFILKWEERVLAWVLIGLEWVQEKVLWVQERDSWVLGKGSWALEKGLWVPEKGLWVLGRASWVPEMASWVQVIPLVDLLLDLGEDFLHLVTLVALDLVLEVRLSTTFLQMVTVIMIHLKVLYHT
jgi:hypothetical protein